MHCPGFLYGVPQVCATKAADTALEYPLAIIPGMKICFCVACYKRGWQLRCAVMSNLLTLWPYRKDVKMVVVIFDEDEDGVQWLTEHGEYALNEGLLAIATSKFADGAGWHASVA